jgi:LacI family transcriptional regulator
MGKVTIADLAREAGVSAATVDRVLNGRFKVRGETALKVHEAARRIGFHGANAIRSRILAGLPEMHVGVILQKERHAFYRDFANQIEQAVLRDTRHRLRVTIRFAQTTMPAELADMMSSMAGRVNSIAATGIDHPLVTEAVADLRQRGIPTFSLLSDFAQGIRESYIGLNNLKVGRTGWPRKTS